MSHQPAGAFSRPRRISVERPAPTSRHPGQPRWHRRRALRLPVHTTIRVTLGTTTWSCHIDDVSDLGAGLRLPDSVPVEVGMALACHLPAGTAIGEVRSVGAGAGGVHRVGLAWCHVDDPGRGWLRHASRRHAMATL